MVPAPGMALQPLQTASAASLPSQGCQTLLARRGCPTVLPRPQRHHGLGSGRTLHAAGAAVLGACLLQLGTGRGRHRRSPRTVRLAGFGPAPYEAKQKEDITKEDVGARVASLIRDEARNISAQLKQYGYSQINGFLGGSIHGYHDKIRKEMKGLFDRGWFEQQSEEDGSFKIGAYRITHQDTEHRFRAKLLGAMGDEKMEKAVQAQYDYAPTVVNFVRSIIISLAGPTLLQVAGTPLSTNVATAEMMVLCGNGARYDRRVSNIYGWNTKQGFVRDPRKLIAVYFANPTWREELGGHLQLEGVITPTGAVSIAPLHDRLVLFWADKTVWSFRKSQASMISEHQYAIMMTMMAEDKSKIEYNPHTFARWFPELRDRPMDTPAMLGDGA